MLLTWRLYTRNTLASVETLLFLVVFIIWIAFGSWFTFRVTQWMLFDIGIPRALVFSNVFGAIFIIWLIMILAGYRLNESYDPERLKIFPIPLRSIFLTSILNPIFDLSILLPASGMYSVFFASNPYPSQIPVGVIIVFFSLFFTVLAGSTLVHFLYAFLPRISIVKVGMFILFLILVWAILLNLGLVGYPMHFYFLLFVPAGIEYFKQYPTGQAGIILDAFMNGNMAGTGPILLSFASWNAGLLVLNFLLLYRIWKNDAIKKSIKGRIGVNEPGNVFVDLISRLLSNFASPQSISIFKKDMLEFFLRSPYFMLYKALPGSIAPIIIILAMKWNLENVARLSEDPVISQRVIYSTLATVIFIVISQANLFAGNQLGFEDASIRNIFVMPTPRRYILIGKNLFLGGLFLIDAIILSALAIFFLPSMFTFFTWLSLFITLFLLILTIGNFTSSIWPYWMPLDKPSFTLRTTVIIGLVNLGALLILAILYAPPLIAVVLPELAGYRLISYIMMPISVIYAFLIHRFTLKAAVGLLESNEFLVLRRVGDREEL